MSKDKGKKEPKKKPSEKANKHLSNYQLEKGGKGQNLETK